MHILIDDDRFLLFHSESEFTMGDMEKLRCALFAAYWCPPVQSYVITKDRIFGNYGAHLDTNAINDLILKIKQYETKPDDLGGNMR
jgi:hypothetical protein